MCIYYTDKDALHYDSEEHIIPAGIGGIAVLPREYVSSEFNTEISGLELDFMREGLISIPRPIVGPGKRGSLNAKKVTKSSVHVIRNTNDESPIALGYTKLGKVYEIPHLLLNTLTGENSFSCNIEEQDMDGQIRIAAFKDQCLLADALKVKVLSDSSLPVDLILLGIKEDIEKNYNCFLVKHPANTFDTDTEKIKQIGVGIHFGRSPQFTRYMPRVHQKVKVSIEHFRIYGKIAFNFLSFIKGSNFALQPQFNAVRNWIAYGKEYPFFAMDPQSFNPLKQMGIAMPEYAHIVFLVRDRKQLMAKVFLFGGFSVEMLLSNEFSGDLYTDGLICDWKNRKEYRLNEYLALST